MNPGPSLAFPKCLCRRYYKQTQTLLWRELSVVSCLWWDDRSLRANRSRGGRSSWAPGMSQSEHPTLSAKEIQGSQCPTVPVSGNLVGVSRKLWGHFSRKRTWTSSKLHRKSILLADSCMGTCLNHAALSLTNLCLLCPSPQKPHTSWLIQFI